MTRLNRELIEPVDDVVLRKRFNTNVELIRNLMYEITHRVQWSQPKIKSAIENRAADGDELTSVFEMLDV